MAGSLFFKKPSYALNPTAAKAEPGTSTPDQDAVNFFSRSDTYKGILAESARKRRQEEEDKLNKTRKKSAKSVERSDSGHKRRRISKEADDGSESDDSVLKVKSEIKTRSKSLSESPAKSLTNRYERSLPKPSPKPDIIELSSSDSEDDKPVPSKESSVIPNIREERGSSVELQQVIPVQNDNRDFEDEADPDEPFPELVAKARAKARDNAREDALDQQATERRTGTPTTPTIDDPTVSLLVTSRIENTVPLIVKRRISQRLREVRQAWCSKQGFDQRTSDSIIFTFRKSQVQDSTTLKSFVSVDLYGKPYLKTNNTRGGLTDDGEKVVVEATTLEILKEDKLEAERKITRPDPEAEPEEEVLPVQPLVKHTKIIIKSKDKSDFRLKVKSTTTMWDILGAWCKLHNASPNEYYLQFDDERLASDLKMEDSGIEDMENLEVHESK